MGGLLRLFMYLISMLWIVVGVLLVFVPDFVREKFYKELLKKVQLKKLAALPIAFGVLLLMASPYNRHTLIVTLLGLLGIIKGILLITTTEKMEKLTDWWLNKASSNICRIWGIVAVIIGSVVLMGI